MLYNIGEKIITKKTHACGKNVWTVVRTGADYKLKCDGCGRFVIFEPDALRKAVKGTVKPK